MAKVWITEKADEVCRDCKFYMQHYVYINSWGQKGYIPCAAGHCIRSRLKNKEPWDSCKYFDKKQDKT